MQVTFFYHEQMSKIARFAINHKTWSHVMNADTNVDDSTLPQNQFVNLSCLNSWQHLKRSNLYFEHGLHSDLCTEYFLEAPTSLL